VCQSKYQKIQNSFILRHVEQVNQRHTGTTESINDITDNDAVLILLLIYNAKVLK